jgi:molybdopterin-synthase adenylyltransferase
MSWFSGSGNMSERFHHESAYRGAEDMKSLRNASTALCGAGAVGSNLAVNLARQGFGSLALIDRDRIEPRNLGTQIWSESEVGLFKADCLRNRLFDEIGLEARACPQELSRKTVKKILGGASLVVDSFDNSDSRETVSEYCRQEGLPCLHVGLSADYAEVIWNESYKAPPDRGLDLCDYPLARNLILMAVAVASESLVRYITRGRKESYTVTLGDFAVRELSNAERE